MVSLVQALGVTVTQGDGSRVSDIWLLKEKSYDYQSSRLNTESTFIQGGQVKKSAYSIRYYSFRELIQLLEEAGFANCQGYETQSQELFRGVGSLNLIATKK